MPRDINGANTLFGGRALEWLDEEAAIYAMCQLKHAKHLVTKAMSAIEFMAPAKCGDIIELGNEVVKVGRTSITVSGSIRNKTTKQEILRVANIVFVNLDEDGKPTPHGIEINP